MANISKQFTEDIVLPDGSIASSVGDIDRYLQANDLAHASDYTDEFRRNVRYKQQKRVKAELFSEFIKNYKGAIWNE